QRVGSAILSELGFFRPLPRQQFFDKGWFGQIDSRTSGRCWRSKMADVILKIIFRKTAINY
ncbi:MAG: hypothetical protein FWC59_03915, partial [Actinomycetia bacterium]|nr:hypothetical protein [Actinomycetes bacterium]